jgi:hypothetical protein
MDKKEINSTKMTASFLFGLQASAVSPEWPFYTMCGKFFRTHAFDSRPFKTNCCGRRPTMRQKGLEW